MKGRFFRARNGKAESDSISPESFVCTDDIRADFLTRSSAVGFGRSVILRSLYDSEDEVSGKHELARQAAHPRMDPEPKHLNSEQVEKLREQLSELKPAHARYLYDKTKGAFMRAALFDHEDDLGFYDTQSNPIGQRINEKAKHRKSGENPYRVSDETVVNFAEWYMSQTLEAQQRLDAEVDELKLDYKNKVADAIRRGWLPERVYLNLFNIDSVDVLQDDMFATDVQNLAGAYYHGNRSEVVLSPFEDSEFSTEDTLIHEVTHALSNDNKANYTRRTLLSGVFGEHGSRIVNEMLTEHLAQSLIYGDFETIDPVHRSKIGAYPEYRLFFEALVNHGTQKIDKREFYDALYFTQQESSEDFYNDPKVNLLLNKIEDAFPGADVIQRLRMCRSDNDFRQLLPLMHSSVRAAAKDKVTVAAAEQWGNEFDDN